MIPGNRQRQLTVDDVTNQGRYLLNDFIHERLQNDGIENVPGMEVLQEPGTPRGEESFYVILLRCDGYIVLTAMEYISKNCIFFFFKLAKIVPNMLPK